MANIIEMSQTSISHMALSPISKLTTTWSSDVFIHGIPWQVKFCRACREDSLAIVLHCVKVDSSNWSVPACATVKLMPFAQNKSPHVRHVAPFVFGPSELSIGESSVIEWTKLMSDQSQYVRNPLTKAATADRLHHSDSQWQISTVCWLFAAHRSLYVDCLGH